MMIYAQPRCFAAQDHHLERDRLRMVVRFSPTFFQILKPINVVQQPYYCDGFPKPGLEIIVSSALAADGHLTAGNKIELPFLVSGFSHTICHARSFRKRLG